MYIKLRQAREKRGLSQAEMSEILLISQPQYHRKETGLSSFNAAERLTLAQFFDKKVDELFDKAEISQNNH